MDSVERCRIIFHLGSGQQVSILCPKSNFFPQAENLEDITIEEVAETLWEVVKKGPTWLLVESLAVFTGTVSAIEVYDLPDGPITD